MKRTLLLAAVLLFSTATVLGQAVSPNIERGFDPQKAYAFGEVEAISLFNGNVNVPIAMGPEYQVGGSLSYRVVLNYAGNSWEIEERMELIGPMNPPEQIVYDWSYPSRRDNAGMGWRLHFGRLLAPGASGCTEPVPNVPAQQRHGYEAPDGAVHCFYSTLHGVSGESSTNTWYTRDGSYLRLVTSAAIPRIEFPDGTTHEFNGPQSPYEPGVIGVTKIADRFTNWVQFDYSASTSAAPNWSRSDTPTAKWKIWDSTGREHYVFFAAGPEYNETIPYENNEVPHSVVAEVQLAGPNGPAAYKLDYEKESGNWPLVVRVESGDGPNYENLGFYVPAALLQSVELPEGGTYQFQHSHGNNTPTPTAGTLTSLTLPTLGRITWEYLDHYYPSASIPVNQKVGVRGTTSTSVKTRRMYDRGATQPLGRREYTYTVDYAVAPESPIEKSVMITEYSGDDSSTTILSRQQNFFSVCVDNHCPSGAGPGFYSLPLTFKARTDGVSVTDGSRWLSSITYGPGSGWTEVKGRTYVEYEGDIALTSSVGGKFDLNRRMKSQSTFSHEGGGTAYSVTSSSSDFDGLGHYRQETTSSTVPGSISRTTTTSYNANLARGSFTPLGTNTPSTYMIAATDPWLPNLYDSVTSVESGAGATASATEVCMSRTTGVLARKRTLRGAVPALGDLLAVFGYDSGGNVTSESYYGGDVQPLPVGFSATCTDSLGTPQYTLSHTYPTTAIPLRTTTQGAMPFKALDVTMHLASGFVSESRDTAGAATTFTYDQLGRLKTVTTTGSASTQITYTNATASAPAQAQVRQFEPATPTTPFSDARYYYDGFGRLIQQRVWQPDATSPWAVSDIVYDSLGRKVATTVAVAATTPGFSLLPSTTKRTTSTLDYAGRPLTVTQPDQTQTTFEYTGSRMMKRSNSYAGPSGTAVSKTVETYDGAGRMISIIENAETSGAVSTAYTYDVGNRLTSVAVSSDNAPQLRTFTYDRAGLLWKEQHPESGLSEYVYDARGHVREKKAAQCRSYLRFSYDGAERVTLVESHRPSSPCDEVPDYQPLKEFTFGGVGSSNSLGRLIKSVRHNRIAMGNVSVTDTYVHSAAGQVTQKTTAVKDETAGLLLHSFQQSYEYYGSGQMQRINYPLCYSGDGCGTSTSRFDSVRREFTRGILTATVAEKDFGVTLSDVWKAADFTYHPTGMKKTIVHGNGITDTIGADPNGMARPQSFTYSGQSTCTVPTFTTLPQNQTVAYGAQATLTASASGTGTISYQWMEVDPIPTATSATYVTTAITTTRYFTVVASSTCGKVTSSYVTITPKLATPGNLVATAVKTGAQWSVSVSWSATAGTTSYTVERRSGGAYVPVATVSTASFTDSTCPVGATCIYRVKATASNVTTSDVSGSDLATLRDYTPSTSLSSITNEQLDEILDTVNAIRAATGQGALIWSAILPLNTPVPANQAPIKAAHLESLRTRMDEALSLALLPRSSYTDVSLAGKRVSASYLHELQARGY